MKYVTPRIVPIDGPENSPRRTLVIGLGGAGMSIAQYVQGQSGCGVLAVDTAAKALKHSRLERKLLIGPTICEGGGATVPVRGRRAAEESRNLLKEALVGVETLVLIAGLGGATGTGAAAVIIDLAQSVHLPVIVAVVLPFEFEAGRREIAVSALLELRSKGVTVLVYDNADAVKNHCNPIVSLPEVFESVALGIAADIGAIFH